MSQPLMPSETHQLFSAMAAEQLSALLGDFAFGLWQRKEGPYAPGVSKDEACEWFLLNCPDRKTLIEPKHVA